MASSKNTVNGQRGAAREKVRAMQEAQRRSERRQRSLIITSAVVVAAILVGVVVFAVARAQANQPDLAKVVVPTGITDTGGITEAAADGGAAEPVRVVEYLDYQCPACQQFDTTVGPYLQEQVAAGNVEIEYHPLNLLKQQSTTDYSLRSANAAYCLADDGEGDISAFSDALYADQPPEGGAGLPDADLVAAAKDAGASDTVEQCVTSGKHSGYVNQQTDTATTPRDGEDQALVRATPTVIIDGEQVQDTSLAGVTAAVEAAAR